MTAEPTERICSRCQEPYPATEEDALVHGVCPACCAVMRSSETVQQDIPGADERMRHQRGPGRFAHRNDRRRREPR